MPRQVFVFDPPERFVAGTVGEPGQRTFFLQARAPGRLTTVALEKEQVAVLAQRLDELLDEVLRRSGGQAPVPALASDDTEDLGPLEQPIEEEFRVGTLTLAWDADDERVVVEAFAVTESAGEPAIDEPEVDEVAAVEQVQAATEHSDVLQVRLTGASARAFVRRARAVVSAGRPPCPLCAQPLDPLGHVCPRQNGFRRRE